MSERFPIVRRPNPENQRPVLVSSPHSGRWIPEEERRHYGIDTTELLHDGDLYVDELYVGVEALGATFVTTPYSRFVIDLNRLPDDVSPRGVKGATARKGPGYYGDRGAIWAVTTHGESIYEEPLSDDDFRRRRTRYYDPYHAFLSEELERLRARFGYAILLDAHSMPSRATRLHSDAAGRPRADIVPGDLLGSSCGAWLTRTTEAFWRSRGFEVAPNSPYRGGGIVRRHGRPARRVHAIQLEVNRALYMDEDTLERLPGLLDLRADCLAFVDVVAHAEPPDTD